MLGLRQADRHDQNPRTRRKRSAPSEGPPGTPSATVTEPDRGAFLLALPEPYAQAALLCPKYATPLHQTDTHWPGTPAFRPKMPAPLYRSEASCCCRLS